MTTGAMRRGGVRGSRAGRGGRGQVVERLRDAMVAECRTGAVVLGTALPEA